MKFAYLIIMFVNNYNQL